MPEHIRQERNTDARGAIHDKSAALLQAGPGLGRPSRRRRPILPLLLALAGLGLVVLGGALLVDGAVFRARAMVIGETVIGLTIVAVGMSMPELVTSVIAALKRQGMLPSAKSSAPTSTTSSESGAQPR